MAIGGTAQAATLTVGSGTASSPAGGAVTPNPIVFSYTADATTSGYGARILYDAAQFDATAVSQNGATCNTAVDGQITVVNNDTNGAVLASGPQCNITFTAANGIPAATYPLDLTTSNPGEGCFDAALAPTTCTLVDGSIQASVGPTPTAPTIALTPNPASIPAGPAGAGSVAITIDTPVDATNGGNATVTCAIPAGTVGFTAGAVTGNPFTNGTGSVTVGCTRGAAADTQTLTCTATAGGGATGTTTATTNVTCPAATVVVQTSEFNANLNATLVGPPSGTGTGTIAITNSGDGPLTITCGAPSAGFTVTSPPAASTPAGGSTSIGLSCAVPAGGATTGTLVCNTNDPDEGTVTFALSCVAQAIAVPTMGGFAKGMLAAMLAAVGLLGFALRRKLV